MTVLDPVLKVGSAFDWITPLKAFLNPIIHGPVYTFMITYSSCPYSTREITRALKKRGVSVYSPLITGNTILFDVKLKQAAWANHLMDQWGVPVENPLPKKKRKRKRKRKGNRR